MGRLLIAAIALCVCGCRDPELDRIRSIKEEVCKCKTIECGEAAIKKLPSSDAKPTTKQQALANDMLGCMARIYLKDRPETDPDRPSSPGSSGPASARTP